MYASKKCTQPFEQIVWWSGHTPGCSGHLWPSLWPRPPSSSSRPFRCACSLAASPGLCPHWRAGERRALSRFSFPPVGRGPRRRGARRLWQSPSEVAWLGRSWGALVGGAAASRRGCCRSWGGRVGTGAAGTWLCWRSTFRIWCALGEEFRRRWKGWHLFIYHYYITYHYMKWRKIQLQG